MSATGFTAAPPISRITTTIDDRPASERAVPVATALAHLSGAPVELLSVDPEGLSESRARRRLDHVARLVPADVSVTTTIAPTTGSVADALRELDRGPGSILCLATHGRGTLATLAFGSVAGQLMRDGRRPLLLVGPACDPDAADRLAGPALVALDGGDRDEAALTMAAAWSRATGASLTVTTTITRPGDPDAWAEADQVLLWAGHRATELGGAVATSLVAAGDPAEGILRASLEPPSCIVVGSHRRGALGRMVLGSTVTQVVRQARCPVLVAGAPSDD